jgi:hypothetical protein
MEGIRLRQPAASLTEEEAIVAPQPPTRVADEDFHYHVYDYQGSDGRGPYKLSDEVPNRGQFYSLYQDLRALWEYGSAKKVPGMAFGPLPGDIDSVDTDKVRDFRVLMLSFGGARENAPEVLFTGGIHGREWIAVETAYLLAEYLIKNYTTRPQASQYEQELRQLIDSRRIHVIPMLNPAGQHHTVYSDTDVARLWRKNRRALPSSAEKWVSALTRNGRPNWPFRTVEITPDRVAKYEIPWYSPDKNVPPNPATKTATCALGNSEVGVDLNRNFTTKAWGYTTRPDQPEPKSLTYFGPRPHSEAESGIVIDFLARTPSLRLSIDYHSYAQAIIYSGEAYNTGGVDGAYQAIGAALQSLITGADGGKYELGSPLSAVLGEATGTIADHIAEWKKVPAFTIELDPAFGTDEKPGFGFSEKNIRKVFEGNIRGALMALVAAGRPTSEIGSLTSLLAQWKVFDRGNQLPA